MAARLYVEEEYAEITIGGLMARKTHSASKRTPIDVRDLPEPRQREYSKMTEAVHQAILGDTNQKELSSGKVLSSFDW